MPTNSAAKVIRSEDGSVRLSFKPKPGAKKPSFSWRLTPPETQETYFSDEDCFWAKNSLNIFFTAEARRRGVPAMFSQSFDCWNEALDYDLSWKEVSSPDEADITISIRNPQPYKIMNIRGARIRSVEAGVTDSRTLDCRLYTASILLNRDMVEITVLSHEIGHALGIQAHSGFKDDLMYPYGGTTTKPTKRDLATLRYAYAMLN